jgi:hypothetical protein
MQIISFRQIATPKGDFDAKLRHLKHHDIMMHQNPKEAREQHLRDEIKKLREQRKLRTEVVRHQHKQHKDKRQKRVEYKKTLKEHGIINMLKEKEQQLMESLRRLMHAGASRRENRMARIAVLDHLTPESHGEFDKLKTMDEKQLADFIKNQIQQVGMGKAVSIIREMVKRYGPISFRTAALPMDVKNLGNEKEQQSDTSFYLEKSRNMMLALAYILLLGISGKYEQSGSGHDFLVSFFSYVTPTAFIAWVLHKLKEHFDKKNG